MTTESKEVLYGTVLDVELSLEAIRITPDVETGRIVATRFSAFSVAETDPSGTITLVRDRSAMDHFPVEGERVCYVASPFRANVDAATEWGFAEKPV